MPHEPDIVTDEAEAIEALREALTRASAILGFTGAGISTECGVPDFRTPGSPWMVHKPLPFADFLASEAARREAWRRKFAMDDLYAGAQPGRGHQALARLVAAGRMPAVVTQNIDGLHQASGIPSDQVIELHGNGTYARCLACGERHELAEIRAVFTATGEPPECRACGGLVKSATIAFGQAMPAEAMARALDLAATCDLCLAIGSSLVVHPAAGVPVAARRAGARLVILNREPTPLDAIAHLVLRADAGAVLSAVA